MSGLDLQPFLQGFQLVFLQNLGGLIPLFTKYATNIFYGIAVIELVIAGLLVAISSSGFYTFFFKLVKISVFFYLVVHFEDIVHLFLKSVNYIGTNVALFQRDAVGTVSFNGLQHFWDFNSHDNYIYKGIKKSIEQILNQASEYDNGTKDLSNGGSSMISHNDSSNAETKGVNINNHFFLGMAQLVVMIMTVVVAMYYIISFYINALVSLLLSPFGQLSITASLFRNSFSSFVQSSVRLMIFIIVYVSFVLFTTTLKLEHSFSTLGNNGPVPDITFFAISLTGLCLCWLIPREVSLYVSGLLSSSFIPESGRNDVTATNNTVSGVAVAASTSGKESNERPVIQSTGAAVNARTVSMSLPEINRTAGSQTVRIQGADSAQGKSSGESARQLSATSKQLNALLKKYSGNNEQKIVFGQDITKEYAQRLRKNLHSAIGKGDKQ